MIEKEIKNIDVNNLNYLGTSKLFRSTNDSNIHDRTHYFLYKTYLISIHINTMSDTNSLGICDVDMKPICIFAHKSSATYYHYDINKVCAVYEINLLDNFIHNITIFLIGATIKYISEEEKTYLFKTQVRQNKIKNIL